MIRSLHRLQGCYLISDEARLGVVRDVYVDDAQWVVRYVVAEPTSLERDDWFLVSPIAVSSLDPAGRAIHLHLPRERLETAPGIDLDRPVSVQGESAYYDHFGWPYYWQGGALWGGAMTPMAMTAAVPQEPAAGEEAAAGEGSEEDTSPAATSDRHLRSVSEMTGYRVRATDDEIGHVEDFLVDEDTWRLTHVVIDTGSWLFGKKVAVPTDVVEQVSWSEGMLYVALTRDEVTQRRAYDEDDPGQLAA